MPDVPLTTSVPSETSSNNDVLRTFITDQASSHVAQTSSTDQIIADLEQKRQKKDDQSKKATEIKKSPLQTPVQKEVKAEVIKKEPAPAVAQKPKQAVPAPVSPIQQVKAESDENKEPLQQVIKEIQTAQPVTDPVSDLEKQKAQLIIKRQELETSEHKPLSEISRIEGLLKQESEKLIPFTAKERELDSRINEMREREKGQTDLESIRILQQDRWKLEDERIDTEKQKWGITQKIETLNAEKNLKTQEVEAMRRQGDIVDQKIANIDREVQRVKVSREVESLKKQKVKIEDEWITKNEERSKLQADLKFVENDIRITSDERTALENQEHSSDSTREEREVEKLRQDAEQRLRKSEQKRWDIISAIKNLERSLDLLKPTYQQAIAREDAMKKLLESLM